MTARVRHTASRLTRRAVVVVFVVVVGPHLVFSLLNFRVLTLVQPASPTIWLTTHLSPGKLGKLGK